MEVNRHPSPRGIHDSVFFIFLSFLFREGSFRFVLLADGRPFGDFQDRGPPPCNNDESTREAYLEIRGGGPKGGVEANDGSLADLAGADHVVVNVRLPRHDDRCVCGLKWGWGVDDVWEKKKKKR